MVKSGSGTLSRDISGVLMSSFAFTLLALVQQNTYQISKLREAEGRILSRCSSLHPSLGPNLIHAPTHLCSSLTMASRFWWTSAGTRNSMSPF